jgi:predicted amidohydrolase YtcJ
VSASATTSVLILRHANILTMDDALTRAEAIAIDRENGRILAVGSSEAMRERYPAARAADMQGRTIVPGFNDCHMHILPYGLDLARADLSPAAGVTSVPELIAALQRWCAQNPQSAWALGNRYDQNVFPGAAHPTRWELDAAFPDRPVYLIQTSKHGAVANSVALRLAGVTRETPDPPGGEIVRNADGEPTGVLLESAMGLVAKAVPAPTASEKVAAIHRAHEALLRAGIASASDLNTQPSEITLYRQAVEQGAPVRMTLCPHAPAFGAPESLPEREAFARQEFEGISTTAGGLRLGPIKLFSDGALTVRTAALRQPYVDGSGMGMLLHEPEELKAYITTAHLRGWQVAVHAIGDRAVELVLDCYEAAEALAPGTAAARRHRVEHAMLLDEGLIARFARQKVIPVAQPEFLARLGDAYVLGLGRERASRINPTASLQRAGVAVPFSSDCPIVPGAPLDGIRAAARRVTRAGLLLGPEERIPPAQGLRNYTYYAACSTFDETNTGTLEPGKRADLTILSDDPTTEGGLDAAQVISVMIGGRIVYGADVW